jgi:hypothetical protein
VTLHGNPYAASTANRVGRRMTALGEIVRRRHTTCANVERRPRNMKALTSWPETNEVIRGFAASVKGQSFLTM